MRLSKDIIAKILYLGRGRRGFKEKDHGRIRISSQRERTGTLRNLGQYSFRRVNFPVMYARAALKQYTSGLPAMRSH